MSSNFTIQRKYVQAALLLGVSRNLIYQLINTGKLNTYNLSIRRTIILKKGMVYYFRQGRL